MGFWVAMTRKGAGEVVGGVADRDAPLLHGFEEGGLDLGGSAVDFVGEEQVGEDGALVDAELAGAVLEDFCTDDV